MNSINFQGLRCIGLTRCSTIGQAGDGLSNDQQVELLRKFAADHGMIWMAEERAEGVSGSRTSGRNDIENLLERAEVHKDYDVLLIQNYDRLTRGGADHGGYLLFRFAQLNVRVVSITNDIPDNEYAPLIQVVEFIKGEGQARSISLCTSRGQIAAYFDGRMAHCRRLPYGIDRLILTNAGQKLFRIRNLVDGTQLKLNWHNDDVIDRYERNPSRGKFVHFRKEPTQKMILINGAPEAVETVKFMYDQFYFHGKGVHAIAMALNDRGIPAARGGTWNQCSVYNLVKNPVFIQKGIFCLVSRGMHHKLPTRRGDAPIRQKNPKRLTIQRDPIEWLISTHPDIKIIPEDQREAIWEAQYATKVRHAERVQKHEAAGKPIRRLVHANSPHILIGSAFDKATGHLLAARTTGRNGDHRSYVLNKRLYNPTSKDRWNRNFFPAEPIERLVLKALTEILGSGESYAPVILEYANERLSSGSKDVPQVEEMKAEREKLRAQKAFTAVNYNDVGEERLRQMIAPMTVAIQGLDRRIAAAEKAAGRQAVTPAEVVKSVIAQMSAISESVGQRSLASLRTVMMVFTRTVLDFAMSEAELEIHLPNEAIQAENRLQAMCSISQTQPGRQPNSPVAARGRQALHYAEARPAPVTRLWRWLRPGSPGFVLLVFVVAGIVALEGWEYHLKSDERAFNERAKCYPNEGGLIGFTQPPNAASLRHLGRLSGMWGVFFDWKEAPEPSPSPVMDGRPLANVKSLM